MFPLNLLDNVLSDHARRIREVNCFGWMRAGLSRGLGGRFGKRDRRQDG
jgi:hypothetical protein